MKYDHVLTHGLGTAGGFLWDTIKHKCPTHNDTLAEMNNRQRILAAYSKGRPMDNVQMELLQDIKFLETIAWRMYMFGIRRTALTASLPNTFGELVKRAKNDPEFHKRLSHENLRKGTCGCEETANWIRKAETPLLYRRKPCLKPGCKHGGMKAALKWLKADMRVQWEREILSKYSY